MSPKEQSKKTFYRALRGIDFLVPCQKKENGQITFELLSNQRGEQYIPVFFSKDSELGRFQLENMEKIPFQFLRNLMIEMSQKILGFVIEPFDKSIVVDRKGLSDYDSATMGMTVEQRPLRGGVQLKAAKSLPPGMEAALCRFFSMQIGVNAAWTLMAQFDEEQTPHLRVVVDFYGSKFELFPKLAEVIKPFMLEGQQFELIPRQPQINFEPFDSAKIYDRGRFLAERA